MHRSTTGAGLVLLITLVSAHAAAQDEGPAVEALLDGDPTSAARGLIDAGHFEEGLVELGRLQEEVTRSTDLLTVLELRALAQLALGRRAALTATLRQIIAIAPDHTLPTHFTPDLVAELEDARTSGGALGVTIAAHRDGGEVDLRVSLSNDPGSLVTHTVVRTRVGSGAWSEEQTRRLSLTIPPTASLDYEAQAIGPGSIVLASSERARSEGVAVETAEASDADDSEDARAEGAFPWVWLGVGVAAAVVIAAVVVIAVVASDGGDGAYVPVVEF